MINHFLPQRFRQREHRTEPTLTHMPHGVKSSNTDKQKRKAEHIEDGYKKKWVSSEEAEGRAWATVNKQDGGGK